MVKLEEFIKIAMLDANQTEVRTTTQTFNEVILQTNKPVVYSTLEATQPTAWIHWDATLNTQNEELIYLYGNATDLSDSLFFNNATNATETTPHNVPYKWFVLSLFLLVVAGIMGNGLVITAIWFEKKLQNVTNYFLLSLAIADLLVSLIVMPLSILQLFMGRYCKS